MQFSEQIQNLITLNPNGEGFVPMPNISDEELKTLKKLNSEYRDTYHKDIIIF